MHPVTAAEGSPSLASLAVTLRCPPFACSLCQASVSPSAFPKAWWHKQAVSPRGKTPTATPKGTQLCPPGETHPPQEPCSIDGNQAVKLLCVLSRLPARLAVSHCVLWLLAQPGDICSVELHKPWNPSSLPPSTLSRANAPGRPL